MAKITNAMSFKNAEIKEDCIEEVTKDAVYQYSLANIIERWKGIQGLSIVIKCDSDVEPDIEDACDG